MKPAAILIGIDPGTHTGLAVWDRELAKFICVCSLPIHEAMGTVRVYANDIARMEVVFEDARQRRWFGNAGREKLQGAGSVKRDCTIWEDYLTSLGVQFKAMPPQKGATKWTAEQFKRATGWAERTNEHGRDAAMLVFKR